ncbi:MAG: ABC transporter ATP-binding protein, partial [Sphingosinicella sp.]|nr:ABC transporter ATP-binding protein [Sphingosinicella sp.]
VLIVSHDRDFLDRTVTMVVGLDGSGRADVVAGGFADWEKKRTQRIAPKTSSAPAAEAPRTARTKLSYKDQRELDLLPGEIEALNAEIALHEESLANPALYTRDPDGFMRISAALDAARARLAICEDRWLELAEMSEALG